MNSQLIMKVIIKVTYYLMIGVIVALALVWIGVIPVGAEPVGKVVICHIPPGNPDNAHTIEVGAPAVPAHLAHGDSIGVCIVPKRILTPILTPAIEGADHLTGASSVAIPAVSLPLTGAEVKDESGRNLWPLLFVGILSSGMAVVVRRHR